MEQHRKSWETVSSHRTQVAFLGSCTQSEIYIPYSCAVNIKHPSPCIEFVSVSHFTTTNPHLQTSVTTQNSLFVHMHHRTGQILNKCPDRITQVSYISSFPLASLLSSGKSDEFVILTLFSFSSWLCDWLTSFPFFPFLISPFSRKRQQVHWKHACCV